MAKKNEPPLPPTKSVTRYAIVKHYPNGKAQETIKTYATRLEAESIAKVLCTQLGLRHAVVRAVKVVVWD